MKRKTNISNLNSTYQTNVSIHTILADFDIFLENNGGAWQTTQRENDAVRAGIKSTETQ